MAPSIRVHLPRYISRIQGGEGILQYDEVERSYDAPHSKGQLGPVGLSVAGITVCRLNPSAARSDLTLFAFHHLLQAKTSLKESLLKVMEWLHQLHIW